MNRNASANSRPSKSSSSSNRAFTLAEVLVCVALLAVMGTLLIPAHAASRVRSQNARCLANMGQLMAGLLMYSQSNRDFMPPNPNDGNVVNGHNWCQGMAGRGQNAEFNPDILANPAKCLVAPYIQTNVSLFRCTVDQRTGRYQGTDPALLGKTVPAARSVSMNQAVGTICRGFDAGAGHSGAPTNSVNGPWLNNIASHRRNSPYRTYGKIAEMIVPAPARLWVLTEEDPNSLNDAGFAFGMNTSEWIDFPGTLHNVGGVLGFADGHAELHKWVDPRTVVSFPVSRTPAPNSADWQWLAQRTSARAQ